MPARSARASRLAVCRSVRWFAASTIDLAMLVHGRPSTGKMSCGTSVVDVCTTIPPTSRRPPLPGTGDVPVAASATGAVQFRGAPVTQRRVPDRQHRGGPVPMTFQAQVPDAIDAAEAPDELTVAHAVLDAVPRHARAQQLTTRHDARLRSGKRRDQLVRMRFVRIGFVSK